MHSHPIYSRFLHSPLQLFCSSKTDDLGKRLFFPSTHGPCQTSLRNDWNRNDGLLQLELLMFDVFFFVFGWERGNTNLLWSWNWMILMLFFLGKNSSTLWPDKDNGAAGSGTFLLSWKVMGSNTKWPVGKISHSSRWSFQIFSNFTPTWGRFPFLLIFFKGLKPPTTVAILFIRMHSWKIM